MELARKGFVARVVYGYRSETPRAVSLCKLFWLFWFSLLIMWPSLIFFGAIVVVCYFSIATPLVFLFGFRPGLLKDDARPFVPIQYWPQIYGHRVWPGGIFLAIAAAIGIFKLFYLLSYNRAFVLWAIFMSCIIVPILVFYMIGRLAGLIKKRESITELADLISGYWSAVKERICPLVIIR